MRRSLEDIQVSFLEEKPSTKKGACRSTDRSQVSPLIVSAADRAHHGHRTPPDAGRDRERARAHPAAASADAAAAVLRPASARCLAEARMLAAHRLVQG